MIDLPTCNEWCLQVWEIVGIWIASIGTVAAVFAAIWIAHRDSSVRLRVSATIGIIIGDPYVGHDVDHIWINVVNIGRRTVTLSNIGWRTGLLHHKSPYLGRKYAMQTAPHGGAQVPLKLADGDTMSWMIPLESWLKNEPQKLVGKPYWLRLHTIYVQAHSSTGEVRSSRISSSVRREIAKAIRAAK